MEALGILLLVLGIIIVGLLLAYLRTVMFTENERKRFREYTLKDWIVRFAIYILVIAILVAINLWSQHR